MGKKPGLGLAILIVVGLSAWGCRSSNSSVAPPNSNWKPPPVPGTPTTQGTTGNPAARTGPGGTIPSGPAGFPTGNSSSPFASPSGGLAPASATSMGSSGSSAATGSFAGRPPAAQTGALPSFAPAATTSPSAPSAPAPVAVSSSGYQMGSQYPTANATGAFGNQGVAPYQNPAPTGYGTNYYSPGTAPNQSITVNGGTASPAGSNGPWR